MKRGFTLVELSIVLVIIGLLIGGVLVAQSMITTTKDQAAILQLQQYDIAVANFKTKFNSLPGDSTLFSPQGNGDGLIGQTDPDGSVWITGHESGYFWQHLFQSGFTQQKQGFTDTVPVSGFDTTSQTPNAPELIVGKNAAVNPGSVSCYAGITTTNCYIIGTMSLYGFGAYFAGVSVPSTDTLAMDTKIDDGVANRGSFRASGASCASSGTYNVSSSANTCVVYVKMMLSNGQ